MNRLWWVALLGPLWIVLALCTYWEPVTRDGWWNSYWYILHDLSPGKIISYVGENWDHANPRLGQTWTLLLYWPGPFRVIVTPLMILGLFGLISAHALGRRPTPYAFLVGAAILCAVTPQIGSMLFYRPYVGNYVFGLVLNLLWLLPYRFESDRKWLAPVMLVLGVAAGMCNEHTGVAFLAMGLFASWRKWKPWQIAGLVGLLAGYILLLAAPGHEMRYDGLAKQASMLGRVIDRGVVANVRVLWSFIAAMLWAVPWIALGVVGKAKLSRPRPAAEPWSIAYLAGGVLCTLALLASPKLGARLYLHSVALASIAIVMLVDQLAGKLRVIAAVLSAAVLAYGAAMCVITYAQIGPVGRARVEIIRDTPNGESVVIPRYPVGKSLWFAGEDLDERMLTALARDYGLVKIALAPSGL